ncbi:MAG: hypothetical protein IKO86_01935 [Prevotella sp.]|nr:hypothetical protein [Prevotella sp.]
MNNRILSLAAAMVLSLSATAVNIETDRTWYLAGEAMTVSVTTDDAHIAYAELCDMYGLAAGTVVSVKGGKGTGVIELPSNLHSGYYVLSAYTRHNTTASQRLVAVVNPLHKSEDDDIKWAVITHPDSLSYAQAYDQEDRLFDMSLFHQKPVPLIADIRETEGHIIKARVRNVHDGQTFSASTIRPSLAIVGKQIHYFEGKMVNDSIAVFYTYGIHGKKPLVLSAMSSSGVSLPIEMISPFETLLPKELPHLVFHYKRSEVEARSLDMQRHQIAIAPAKRELKLGDLSDDTAEDGVPMDYDETVFGTHPDLTYNLDEYRQFFTIREVLLEYVNCVSNTKIDGVPQLFVRKEQGSYNSSWPAMVLIDGMPVIDIERLLNYDARRIHYINIYSGEYTFGNGVYNGILSFISRSGRLTNYPTEPNVQYLVYEFPE